MSTTSVEYLGLIAWAANVLEEKDSQSVEGPCSTSHRCHSVSSHMKGRSGGGQLFSVPPVGKALFLPSLLSRSTWVQQGLKLPASCSESPGAGRETGEGGLRNSQWDSLFICIWETPEDSVL